jgi:hypothetical protein
MRVNPSNRHVATVHFDDAGRIHAVVLQSDTPNAPPGGILQLPGCHIAEVELSAELAGADPLYIHQNYRVHAKGGRPRLTRAASGAALAPHTDSGPVKRKKK